MVAPRTPKLATRAGAPRLRANDTACATTFSDSSPSEKAQVTLLKPSAAVER